MKVFLTPTGLHSRAMVRTARALARRAPDWVDIVADPEKADLRVVHVIGEGSLEGLDPDQQQVFIQYCARSAGRTLDQWAARWQRCAMVWSYYDLPALVGRDDFPFYHAPLGIDPTFAGWTPCGNRDIGVMTSGYMDGPACEAISEAAQAAHAAGISMCHLGPANVIPDAEKPPGWCNVEDVSDRRLSELLGWSAWVSGLRHVEGFEMPCIEGLACGARPVVFDRPDMRQWYEGLAVFVPECSGQPLVELLTAVFEAGTPEITPEEHARVRERFNWNTICNGFWSALSHRVEVAA